MPWITQSSLLNLSANSIENVLSKQPKYLPVSGRGAVLEYLLPENPSAGKMIKFQMIWGLYRLVWKSEITEWISGEEFHTQSNDDRFSRFESHHILSDRGQKCLIRETIEFESSQEQLNKIMVTASLQHAIDYRLNTGQAAKTTTIQVIGQQSA
jgi:hypothetical protein